MRNWTDLSRRRFLRQAGRAAGAAAVAWPALAWPTRAPAMEHSLRRIAPNKASASFNADVDIELVCRPESAQIHGGRPTRVWRYVASLVKGPENTLTSLPDSYLGPLMRFAKGQKIRIRLRNELPEQTITHWHGLHVPMLMDGHPSAAIEPGEVYVYEFEMRNRAGIYFYHPHTHEATATQVCRGLAGAIIVTDEEERALGLPEGDFEIPIVIQDRSLDGANQLVYGGGMHMGMLGFYGDSILVNGRPDYRIDVASRAYRLRIVNGSNARIYKLAWDDATPLTVIGVDGGLLERPETKPYVMLAPGERLDIWADFRGRGVGSKLVMRSGRFSGVMPKLAERMMGGMMMPTELPVGSEFPIFTVNVTRAVNEGPTLPRTLAKIDRYRAEDVANPGNPVPIAISEAPMSMLLNGRPYDADDIQPRERIPVDTAQLMEIYRERGGMGQGMGQGMGMMHGGMMGGMGGMMGDGMMGGRRMGMMGGMGMMGKMMTMAHPIHLHGEPFQIVERVYEGDDAESYGTLRDGFVDSGPKDTVLVAPGERVRIIKPFHDFKGRFMYHCHNLEHADMGMMREFLVE